MSLDILLIALEALHKETRPRFRCLEAYWMKYYSLSMHLVKDIEISENFTYLGCVVYNDGGLSQELYGGLA